jgi:signal transduction histidine kinase
LTELSELVGVLRSSGSDTAPTRDAPAPALTELVEDSASVGLPVDLVEDGDASQLSPVVGRTAHRVVQEALTNVRKHARGARVRVDARYGPETVRVSVRNTAGNGPDPAIAGSGSRTGLAGLRERVELVGGTLAAGPDGEGGFRVEATMPARVAGP